MYMWYTCIDDLRSTILGDLYPTVCIYIFIYSHTHKLICADLINREAVEEAKKLEEEVKRLQESLDKERAEKVRHCTQPHS